MYWKAAIRAMETEIAHWAHKRRHTANDSDSTNRISHDSFISTNHLIKITMQLLEKDLLNQRVYLKVPSKSWVSLQFTSNHGHRQTYDRYTGRLPFVCALQTQELRNDHPHGH